LRPMDLRDALIQAGMTLSSELSLDAVLQRIIELGAEITGAHYGALGVLAPDGVHLSEFHTTGITPEQRAAIGDLPVGHGLLGLLIEEAHALRIDRIGEHARSVGFPPNHPPMTSLLGAPIVSRGTVFGDIYLTDKDGGAPFTDEDEAALRILAAQAGIAIENARLYEEVQRLVVLEDRERIAKELHDGVIQSLFAVGMSLQASAVMVGDEDLRGRIESSIGEVDRVIRDLRNYIFGLRPGVLADRQLDEAIRTVAKEFEERSGVVTAVEIDESVAAELSSTAGDLIQMAREALSNVGRHAEATTCRVSLFREGDRAIFEIDDDGRGFEPDTASRGQGLTNLERRAEALGGTAELRSEPRTGSTVRISIPLH
jgi:signal transduction histidine kinase